jgi:hypothetical protein
MNPSTNTALPMGIIASAYGDGKQREQTVFSHQAL